jgi:hypothetical protein
MGHTQEPSPSFGRVGGTPPNPTHFLLLSLFRYLQDTRVVVYTHMYLFHGAAHVRERAGKKLFHLLCCAMVSVKDFVM